MPALPTLKELKDQFAEANVDYDLLLRYYLEEMRYNRIYSRALENALDGNLHHFSKHRFRAEEELIGEGDIRE